MKIVGLVAKYFDIKIYYESYRWMHKFCGCEFYSSNIKVRTRTSIYD